MNIEKEIEKLNSEKLKLEENNKIIKEKFISEIKHGLGDEIKEKIIYKKQKKTFLKNLKTKIINFFKKF